MHTEDGEVSWAKQDHAETEQQCDFPPFRWARSLLMGCQCLYSRLRGLDVCSQLHNVRPPVECSACADFRYRGFIHKGWSANASTASLSAVSLARVSRGGKHNKVDRSIGTPTSCDD
jgi:hypothetical protein